MEDDSPTDRDEFAISTVSCSMKTYQKGKEDKVLQNVLSDVHGCESRTMMSKRVQALRGYRGLAKCFAQDLDEKFDLHPRPRTLSRVPTAGDRQVCDIATKIDHKATLESQETIELTHCGTMNMEKRAKDLVAEAARMMTISDRTRALNDQQMVSTLGIMSTRLGNAAQSAAATAEVAPVDGKQDPEGTNIFLLERDPLHEQSTSSKKGPLPAAYTLPIRRDQIDTASRHLHRFFHSPHESYSRLAEQARDNQIPGEWVTVMQQQWLLSSGSKLLWIVGKPLPPGNIDEKIPVAHIVSLAKGLGLPCIWHSCVVPDPQQGGPEDVIKWMMLVSLVYSLVRQLCLLTPRQFGRPRFDYNLELDELFDELDASLASLNKALAILQYLLELSPGLLVCAIDGLELLDHPRTTPHIEKLIDILRNPPQGYHFKVLLARSGFHAPHVG
ncbi:hypothetical protein SCAR479_04518 [Seiridium cardinale]|uniref:Uncharacterized protein n=1 Tax=Seiridium cardinale TaxID=138064 RepID=A0ABR2XXX9_9PEZI